MGDWCRTASGVVRFWRSVSWAIEMRETWGGDLSLQGANIQMYEWGQAEAVGHWDSWLPFSS